MVLLVAGFLLPAGGWAQERGAGAGRRHSPESGACQEKERASAGPVVPPSPVVDRRREPYVGCEGLTKLLYMERLEEFRRGLADLERVAVDSGAEPLDVRGRVLVANALFRLALLSAQLADFLLQLEARDRWTDAAKELRSWTPVSHFDREQTYGRTIAILTKLSLDFPDYPHRREALHELASFLWADAAYTQSVKVFGLLAREFPEWARGAGIVTFLEEYRRYER